MMLCLFLIRTKSKHVLLYTRFFFVLMKRATIKTKIELKIALFFEKG